MRKLGLALALLLASTAFTNAGTISFTYSQDAGAPTTVNGSTDSESITNVNTGNFIISFASGLTNPDLPAPDLLQADNISFTSTGSAGASHTLHLSVVANGLTSPTGLQALLSQFDVTGL